MTSMVAVRSPPVCTHSTTTRSTTDPMGDESLPQVKCQRMGHVHNEYIQQPPGTSEPFPPEVIGTIAYHLRHDARTLYSTSLCNRVLCHESELVLYASIAISRAASMENLLYSLTASDRGTRRRHTVNRLLVDPGYSQESMNSLWTKTLQPVLHLLDNLVELGLYFTAGLDSQLNLKPYPFQLRSLETEDRVITGHLLAHLDSQSSIRSLLVRSSLLPQTFATKFLSPTTLPNLISFNGTWQFAFHFTPQHPVSSLALTVSIYDDSSMSDLHRFLAYLQYCLPLTSFTIGGKGLLQGLLKMLGETLSQLEHLELTAMDKGNLVSRS